LDASGSRSETLETFLKCGAVEGWRRSVGQIMSEMKKYDWIGQVLRRNCLLRQVIEGKIKEG
jgi:hypothetical protein